METVSKVKCSFCLTLHSTGKAPPVGKHHQRQAFTVEVRNGLSGFEG